MSVGGISGKGICPGGNVLHPQRQDANDLAQTSSVVPLNSGV